MMQAYLLDWDQQNKALEQLYWQALETHLNRFSRQELTLTDDFTFNNITRLSLAVHNLLGHDADTAVIMTHLFRITYLSNQLHLRIQDEDEGQVYNLQLKHEILTGDYLFGQALELLLEQGYQVLIDKFTRMLAEINAGLVMKYRLQAPQEEVLHKTKAIIYSTIFYTAAKLADQEQVWEQRFSDFGHQVGMALELTHLEAEAAASYWQQSQALWPDLQLEQQARATEWQHWWQQLLEEQTDIAVADHDGKGRSN